jgi:hypothetical protein
MKRTIATAVAVIIAPRLPARDCKTTVIDRPGFSWPPSRATSAFVSPPHPFDFR